jgi:hypothetical protein
MKLWVFCDQGTGLLWLGNRIGCSWRYKSRPAFGTKLASGQFHRLRFGCLEPFLRFFVALLLAHETLERIAHALMERLHEILADGSGPERISDRFNEWRTG